MSVIERVHAREVLDSRGTPTVEVDVTLAGGVTGRAIVPSGASTGRYEALELRDGDARRYAGKGVRRAVEHVNSVLAGSIQGMEATEQAQIDARLRDLDATPEKRRLGANALLGVSLATAHAAARSLDMPLYRYLARLSGQSGRLLPVPMVNIISGGLHAGRQLDMQDFLIIPRGAPNYSDALAQIVAVWRATGAELEARGYEARLVADEGGFGPALRSHSEALDVLVAAIERARLRPGEDIAFAIDVAASHFYRDGRYHLAAEDRVLDAEGMADLLAGWTDRYPLISVEDPCAEDDWEGWRIITERLGDRLQIIGDDLFTTNPRRLAEGIERGVANAILIKVNQIGTLSETLETLAEARRASYRPVISARSGETEDATIADLAVGTDAGQIKIGSITRSERLAKYNQLLRIEEELGTQARWSPSWVFAGL